MTFEFDSVMKSQRHSLGHILGKSGLDPSEFQWAEAPDGNFGYDGVPALYHRPSRYWFGIGRDYRTYGYSDALTEEGRRVVFTPGNHHSYETHRHQKWSEVEKCFDLWLQYLKRELDSVDFWEAVEAVSLGGAEPASADQPFTAEEQQIIAGRLSVLEERMLAAEKLSKEQAAYVQREFKELRAELKRMRRWQWWKLLLGTIANFSLRHIVPESAVRELLDAAKELFHTLTGTPSLPPG